MNFINIKQEKIDLSDVLFVCAGNIFRSPFAEYYFNMIAKNQTMNCFAFSRGTELFYNKPDGVVINIAKQFGIDLSNHVPRAIENKDISASSVIFAVDLYNLKKILQSNEDASGKVYLLGNFLNKPLDEIEDIKVVNLKNNVLAVEHNFKLIIQAIDNIFKISL